MACLMLRTYRGNRSCFRHSLRNTPLKKETQMSISGINSNNQTDQMWFQSQLGALGAASSSNSSTTTSASSQNTQSVSSFDQLMQTLGNDLQSGNLKSAQQDFSQLQQLNQNSSGTQTANATQGHHHHHHHFGGSKGGANGTASSSSSNSVASFLSNSSNNQTTQPVSSTSQSSSTSFTA